MPRETVISLGRRLPGASSGLTRERHAGRASPGRETGIALLFGLAPGGVYRAGAVTRAAGELLPHRFTLTVPLTRRRFTFCGTGPWGCPPWRLASTLPCGARTFLPRELPHAGDHPAFSGANQRAWGSEGKYSTRADPLSQQLHGVSPPSGAHVGVDLGGRVTQELAVEVRERHSWDPAPGRYGRRSATAMRAVGAASGTMLSSALNRRTTR